MTVTDGAVALTDSLATLGGLTYESPSPATLTYAVTFAHQTAGTCTTHENIAAFTTNSTETGGNATQSVSVCVGAPLTASATATPTFASSIRKDVNQTRIEQANGMGTFAYTVQVTETGWAIDGFVAVANPNDWQDASGITVGVTPSVSTASCAVNGGSAIPTIGAGASVTVPYRCTFASAPSANAGVTDVTVSWDAAAMTTAEGSSATAAPFEFAALTVTDTFNGVMSTLGTITASMGGATYSYPQTVANASAGTCRAYVNTAAIVETAQSAGQTVNMCNTATGALTIGFWQNKNGQAILTGGVQVGNVCAAATWLRTLAPFQDLPADSTCRTLAAYATTVIKAASSKGAAMNAMLKAQMLATAFDVYYSTPSLGGNQTGAPVALGGVMIDLTAYAAGFGSAAKMSVADMLVFAASQSNAGGSLWYGQVKSIQEFAKNAFDDINNARAYIAQ